MHLVIQILISEGQMEKSQNLYSVRKCSKAHRSFALCGLIFNFIAVSGVFTLKDW